MHAFSNEWVPLGSEFIQCFIWRLGPGTHVPTATLRNMRAEIAPLLQVLLLKDCKNVTLMTHNKIKIPRQPSDGVEAALEGLSLQRDALTPVLKGRWPALKELNVGHTSIGQVCARCA